MKYDRFLIGIVTGILLLVAVTIALFFVRTGEQSYVVDDSPAGVVHNYTLALMNGDYKMAYGFLADLKYKPTYAEFTLRFANDDYYYSDPNDIALEIGDVTYTGESAQVSLYTLFAGYDSTISRYDEYVVLVRQGGAWKLKGMPSQLWNYEWYQEPYEEEVWE